MWNAVKLQYTYIDIELQVDWQMMTGCIILQRTDAYMNSLTSDIPLPVVLPASTVFRLLRLGPAFQNDA